MTWAHSDRPAIQCQVIPYDESFICRVRMQSRISTISFRCPFVLSQLRSLGYRCYPRCKLRSGLLLLLCYLAAAEEAELSLQANQARERTRQIV